MNKGLSIWVFRIPIAALNNIVVGIIVSIVVTEIPLPRAALAIGVFLAWVLCLLSRWRDLDRWTDEEYVDKSGIRGFGLARTRTMAWSEIDSVEVFWCLNDSAAYLNRDPWFPAWVQIGAPNKTVSISVEAFGGPHSVHRTLADWYGEGKVKDVKKRGYCGPGPSASGLINAAGAVLVGLSSAPLTAPIVQRFMGPGFPYGWIAGAIAGATLATHLGAFDRFNLLSAAIYLVMAAAGQVAVADSSYPYRIEVDPIGWTKKQPSLDGGAG